VIEWYGDEKMGTFIFGILRWKVMFYHHHFGKGRIGIFYFPPLEKGGEGGFEKVNQRGEFDP